jgi:hypothetical protein
LTIPIVESEEDEGEGGGEEVDGSLQEIASDKNWSQYLHVIQVFKEFPLDLGT